MAKSRTSSRTTYSEVTAEDKDVAVFLCHRCFQLNLLDLPVKSWVAREDGKVVAVLMLRAKEAPFLDVIVDENLYRPFMRLFRLWAMAREWLDKHGVPLVCVTIDNARVHFQSLVRRLGFEAVGDTFDANGNAVETIYGRRMAA